MRTSLSVRKTLSFTEEQAKPRRNWDCYHAIVRSLRNLENDETLLVQSGKPVGVFKTHEYAPAC